MPHSIIHDDGDPGSDTNYCIGYVRFFHLEDDRYPTWPPNGDQKDRPENYFKPYITDDFKNKTRGDILHRNEPNVQDDFEICYLYLYSEPVIGEKKCIAPIKVVVKSNSGYDSELNDELKSKCEIPKPSKNA